MCFLCEKVRRPRLCQSFCIFTQEKAASKVLVVFEATLSSSGMVIVGIVAPQPGKNRV